MAQRAPDARPDPAQCVVCGQPATTRLADELPDGTTSLRPYCDQCVHLHGMQTVGSLRPMSPVRFSLSEVFLFFGIVLGFLGLTADYLGIQGESGFGWHQQLGVAGGVLLVLVGAAFRIYFLGLSGFFIFLISLLADYLKIGSSPGIGPVQKTIIAVAALCIVGGIVLGRLQKAGD